MKIRVVIGALVIGLAVVVGTAHAAFDDYFVDRTMRIDYHHTGDANTEIVSIDRVYEYGTWAGSLENFVDQLNYGAYYHKIYDADSGELIYSRGFDSYFKEYQTSAKGRDGVIKTFHESAIIPSPKAKVIFALEKRQKEGHLEEVFRAEIDPEDVMIIRDEAADASVKVIESLFNGDPHVKADIAIIAEGYTADEEPKFRSDLKRFTKVFFTEDPCKSHREHFNVYGVFKPSQQSGIDEPRHGSFRSSAVSATFNSMGSERYILTEDNKALRDIARHVPYDALYIMINHHRYGGGGIYNFYCTFTADNQWSEYLMVHEFGHSFFGLADEYYTSVVAYEDFYPPGYEPAEPNITAALDVENVKWKHLLTEDIEVPTPWEKADYDTMSLAWQRLRGKLNDRIAKLRREGAPEEEVTAAEEEYNRRDREHALNAHEYLKASKHAGQVGVFEGAGYAIKGLYRPMVDCIMFTKAQKRFCKVCEEAMIKIIEWYSE
ncbi:MAG: peptidase M64 [Candidatus Latescibacteria bacterium]|nr:peptidase M64 [Candidatus Latescibacterota bacterium]NIO57431.1 peptidase M64 [Candidatus Latescibacterota bacterium]